MPFATELAVRTGSIATDLNGWPQADLDVALVDYRGRARSLSLCRQLRYPEERVARLEGCAASLVAVVLAFRLPQRDE
ncbi:hypothetical protein [Bradyrhizobium lablabi]|uniref:hypothetical protein n=1 Tax=Bradyrhizobium lablabi TaxID=722472 RepID=UPI001BA78E9B|nr:hypothetical protein [Bradyrhizobium lablabi]MBR0693505.1 hypothetical protein [Bradyrhizobium lablabi]